MSRRDDINRHAELLAWKRRDLARRPAKDFEQEALRLLARALAQNGNRLAASVAAREDPITEDQAAELRKIRAAPRRRR